MMIMRAIRESNSEHEIYHLLTAYLEAVRMIHPPHGLAAHITTLPIMSADAIARQIMTLVGALEIVSRTLDDQARLVIKEALYVFHGALERVEWLHKTRRSATDARVINSALPALKGGYPGSANIPGASPEEQFSP